jgi:hypothetical protein
MEHHYGLVLGEGVSSVPHLTSLNTGRTLCGASTVGTSQYAVLSAPTPTTCAKCVDWHEILEADEPSQTTHDDCAVIGHAFCDTHCVFCGLVCK